MQDMSELANFAFPITLYLLSDLHIKIHNVNSFIEFPKNHLKQLYIKSYY